jgi:hypothetical protein
MHKLSGTSYVSRQHGRLIVEWNNARSRKTTGEVTQHLQDLQFRGPGARAYVDDSVVAAAQKVKCGSDNSVSDIDDANVITHDRPILCGVPVPVHFHRLIQSRGRPRRLRDEVPFVGWFPKLSIRVRAAHIGNPQGNVADGRTAGG